MGKITFRWTVHRLCRLIEMRLSNKYDCVIIIEGRRGVGKSTLGYLICNGVHEIIAKKSDGTEELIKMNFNPKKDILYSRSDIIKAFNERWYSEFMADELINVTFNRDFYNEDQKRLIKIINMNRDHCNLFVACVPKFQTIDTQIKGLCFIRLTVKKRGIAIVQTPNPTIYKADEWDTDYNEKIERDWMKQGYYKPKYTQLSTFRGILAFRDLTEKERIEYEAIKNEKRNELKEKDQRDLESSNPNDQLYDLLKTGKIKTRDMFNNMCSVLKLKPLNAMQNIRVRMRNEGLSGSLSEYFTEDKKVFEEIK